MKTMAPLTCGVIIESPKGWLLAHSPNRQRWDLPKGKNEPHERPIETVIRECWEETGFDLTPFISRMKDLGVRPFARKKTPDRNLHLFHLKMEYAFEISSLACQVESARGNGEMEMDDFAWVPVDFLPHKISKKLKIHLEERGLISPSTSLVSPFNVWKKNLFSFK